jgi:Cu2+-containing amine oxidase
MSSWQAIPGVRPNIVADKIAESEAAVKANPEFQALLRQWGITNLDMVIVYLDVPPQAKLSGHVCGSKDSDDAEKTLV